MKRSILIFMMIGTVMIFFGCSGDNPMVPKLNQSDPMAKELNQSDQVTTTLAKVKRTFTGICTQVIPPQIEGDNEWYDAADDWRVTGTTIWRMPNPNEFGGTATLSVDAKNPHDENRGVWEMIWSGTETPIEGGLLIVAHATGEGVEGKVKGMFAEWTYTMNLIFGDEENTFFYAVEGNIVKPQGPIKK